MELLDGSDLGELLKQRGGPLEPDEAVGYVLQACEALGPVHARGVVHPDLKLANLFLARRVGRPRNAPAGRGAFASGVLTVSPVLGTVVGLQTSTHEFGLTWTQERERIAIVCEGLEHTHVQVGSGVPHRRVDRAKPRDEVRE